MGVDLVSGFGVLNLGTQEWGCHQRLGRDLRPMREGLREPPPKGAIPRRGGDTKSGKRGKELSKEEAGCFPGIPAPFAALANLIGRLGASHSHLSQERDGRFPVRLGREGRRSSLSNL